MECGQLSRRSSLLLVNAAVICVLTLSSSCGRAAGVPQDYGPVTATIINLVGHPCKKLAASKGAKGQHDTVPPVPTAELLLPQQRPGNGLLRRRLRGALTVANGLPAANIRVLKLGVAGADRGHTTASRALKMMNSDGASAGVLPRTSSLTTTNHDRARARLLKVISVNDLPAASDAHSLKLISTNGLPAAANGRSLRWQSCNGLPAAANGRSLRWQSQNGLPADTADGRSLKWQSQNGLPAAADGRSLKWQSQNGLPASADGRSLKWQSQNGLPASANGRSLKWQSQNGLPASANGRSLKWQSQNGLPASSERAGH